MMPSWTWPERSGESPPAGWSESRQYLLVNFVETYLEFDKAEQAIYEGRLRQEEHMTVKALELTWGDRIRKQALEQGPRGGSAGG